MRPKLPSRRNRHANRYSLIASTCTLILLALAIQSKGVSIYVDTTRAGEPLKHVWQYYGYDECNYTTTPDCKTLMKDVAEMNAEPAYLRQHFLLNTGDGKARLKWGSTNIYTEDPTGDPQYSFDMIDEIFDTVVASGCHPLVEIGFMPKALSNRPEPYQNSQTYKLDGGCYYPPKDYDKWAQLIRRLVSHCAARHKNIDKTWLWELWNEPNIGYWHGSFDQYCQLFDYTEKALHDVLPNAILGGPHTAGAPRFLRNFLNHCTKGTNHVTGEKGTRLDCIGFHAKGGVRLVDDHVQMNLGNQLRIHRTGFKIVADFPAYRNTPIIIGEADPDGCAGCPSSQFPERGYRNVPAYGAYEVATMKYSLDLAKRENVNLKGLVTWAFMFDKMPWFDGYRALATNGIHKPVLNAFKMLGQMTGNEVPLTSEGALGLEKILEGGTRTQSDINGMAVVDGDRVKILLWNYHDLLTPAEPAPVQLKVKLPQSLGEKVNVTHYRIDDTHSNAYTKWLDLGSPQNPTETMIASLKSAMQLQMLNPKQQLDVINGHITLNFKLPRFALSLITLDPQK